MLYEVITNDESQTGQKRISFFNELHAVGTYELGDIQVIPERTVRDGDIPFHYNGS